MVLVLSCLLVLSLAVVSRRGATDQHSSISMRCITMFVFSSLPFWFVGAWRPPGPDLSVPPETLTSLGPLRPFLVPGFIPRRGTIMASTFEMKSFIAEKVQADLAFLWQDKDVELIHQYRLAQRKITTVSRFASLEEDLDRFKALTVKACEIPPEDDIAKAVTLADLVTAWQAARKLNAAELEVKAAASAAPSTAPAFIPTRSYNIMATSFREVHGKKDR